MPGRLRPSSGLRQAITVGSSLIAVLALTAPNLVLAAGGSVTITESGGRYHFTPSTISIKVGESITWTDSTEAPHTVSSDQAGGPMQSSILNQGDSYRATFNSAGDFAYHCEIHSYMHGTVHVESAAAHRTPPPAGSTPLPPTDASTRGSAPMGRRGALLALVGVGTFMSVLLFGTRLRRRAR
jgi:plastocyanin